MPLASTAGQFSLAVIFSFSVTNVPDASDCHSSTSRSYIEQEAKLSLG